MNKLIIVSIVLIIISAGVGFFAGTKFRRNNNSNLYQLRRFGNSSNERPVRGQIISADKGSITIKLQDGSTKIIIIPSSANILQTEKASVSALKVDETVVVLGTENSDGSVTAQDVQLNPRLR